MKRLFIPHMCSVFLLGALTLGSLDATHAASHNEAPMISLDEKADINNFYAVPPKPLTIPSGNQVSVGILDRTDSQEDSFDPLIGALPDDFTKVPDNSDSPSVSGTT